MATATRSLKLTTTQQKQLEKLFNDGVTKYTELSKKLKIDYVAVNKFMTKWKKKHGILTERKAMGKTEASIVNKAHLDPNASTIDRSQLRTAKQELDFLRKFYMERKREEVAVK